MWEDVTRHWISVAKIVISSENNQRQQERPFTWLVEADVTDVSYHWVLTGLRRIIAYITTFEWERRAPKILFSPTFRNDLQGCKMERSLKRSS